MHNFPFGPDSAYSAHTAVDVVQKRTYSASCDLSDDEQDSKKRQRRLNADESDDDSTFMKTILNAIGRRHEQRNKVDVEHLELTRAQPSGDSPPAWFEFC
jgi:hypothetical protein